VLRSLSEAKRENKTGRLRKLRSEELDKGNLRQILYIFFLAQQPLVGQGLVIHEVSRSHTTTHHSR